MYLTTRTEVAKAIQDGIRTGLSALDAQLVEIRDRYEAANANDETSRFAALKQTAQEKKAAGESKAKEADQKSGTFKIVAKRDSKVRSLVLTSGLRAHSVTRRSSTGRRLTRSSRSRAPSRTRPVRLPDGDRLLSTSCVCACSLTSFESEASHRSPAPRLPSTTPSRTLTPPRHLLARSTSAHPTAALTASAPVFPLRKAATVVLEAPLPVLVPLALLLSVRALTVTAKVNNHRRRAPASVRDRALARAALDRDRLALPTLERTAFRT